MKLNKKLSFLAVTTLAAVTVLTSCSDDKYWDEDGISGQEVTFDMKSMSVTYNPLTDEIPNPILNVVIRRGTISGVETIQIGAYTKDETIPEDEDQWVLPIDETLWTVPQSVTFADGQKETVIPVKLNTTQMGSYTIGLKIKDNLALGGNKLVVLTVNFTEGDPAPIWRSLGIGTYIDGFYEFKTKCEVQIDDAVWPAGSKGYYGHYRLVNPIKPGMEAEGYYAAGLMETDPSEYIEFYLVPPGNPIPFSSRTWPTEETVTFVMYKDIMMGSVAAGLGSPEELINPARFNSLTNANLANSCVLEWSENPDYEATPNTDEFRGMPAAISFGALLYAEAWGGTTQFLNTKTWRFGFPGYSFGDYSFDLTFSGQVFNPATSQEYLEASIRALGSDCKDFIICCAKSNSPNDVYAALYNYFTERQKSDDPESLPLPEGFIGYDEARIAEGESKMFRYEVAMTPATYIFVACSLTEDNEISEDDAVYIGYNYTPVLEETQSFKPITRHSRDNSGLKKNNSKINTSFNKEFRVPMALPHQLR